MVGAVMPFSFSPLPVPSANFQSMWPGLRAGSRETVPEVVVVPSANSKIVANFSPLKWTMYVLPSSSRTQVPFSLARLLLASSPLASSPVAAQPATRRPRATVVASVFKVGFISFSFVTRCLVRA
jgi:hypothetical protein